jgi:hypothetical protein
VTGAKLAVTAAGVTGTVLAGAKGAGVAAIALPGVRAAQQGSPKTFITYTFKQGENVVYVGRASGKGTPDQVLNQRLGKGHHILRENPGLTPEVQAVQGNRAANRGAEDVWYEYYKREGAPLLNDPQSPPLSSKRSKITRSRQRIQAYADDLNEP